jgi:tRNA (guanine37-N1)-methyltransferase
LLGHPDSVYEESFQKGYFDAPHYTRPVVFEGIEVPSVLRSGNHRDIAKWRQEQGLKKTKEVRPDLFEKISK